MKVAFAALAALLLAVPVGAARVGFIRTPGAPGVSDQAVALDASHWQAALNLLGCDYDMLTQYTLTGNNAYSATPAMRTGIVPRGGPNAGSDTYGLMIHQNWTRNGTVTGNRLSNYNSDSLTLAVGWASIPHILAGGLRVYTGSMFANAAACSTGTSSSLFTLTANLTGVSARMVGTGFVWDAVAGGPFYYRNDANSLSLNRTDPMILRSRVIIGGNAVGFDTNGLTSANVFPDSMTNPASQSSSPEADTSVLWTRERKYVGAVDHALLIYLFGTYMGNGTASDDLAEKCQAIAIADSAAGGTIIGQKPGWSPKKVAVLFDGAFTHTDATVIAGLWQAHATQVKDSLAIKVGRDMLLSLGIPILQSDNLDSIEVYPNEKAWWFGWPNTRYTPMSTTGAMAANGVMGNTSSTLAVDPFGLWRSRTIMTAARALGAPCDGADTSLSCQVQYMRDRLQAYRLPLARTLVASWSNYIPQNMNRNNVAAQDSFALALMRSQYDGVVQGIMALEDNASVSWATNSSLATVTPDLNLASGNPYNYSARERSIVVRAPSPSGIFAGPTSGAVPTLGRFRWLSTRENDEAPTIGLGTAHPLANEWFRAFAEMPWYYSVVNFNHYLHTFNTTASVIRLCPADLGYQQNASSNVTRPGLIWLYRVVNRVRAINAMKWQGTPAPIQFVHADDITP